MEEEGETIVLAILYFVIFQGGLQAIHFAAKAGRVDVIDELLAHGAKVDAKSTVRYLNRL